MNKSNDNNSIKATPPKTNLQSANNTTLLSAHHQERTLHQQFVEYGRNAHEWKRKCALLLPKIAEQKIWLKKGYGSIHEYAGRLAGMSRYQVNEALRVLNKISDKPYLMKVVKKRGINAVKPVVTIATVDNQRFWADKAMEMGKNTLQTYVRDTRHQQAATQQHNLHQSNIIHQQHFTKENYGKKATVSQRSGLPGQPCDNPLNLSPEILLKLKKLKGQSLTWDQLFQQLLKEREQQLEDTKPPTVQAASRHIPAHIERYVLKRSNGQCQESNCLRPYNILHHTQRFALERVHDPNRIVALCKEHEQIAHLGLYDNEQQPPDNWRLLKKADKNNPKIIIDRHVQHYRHPMLR